MALSATEISILLSARDEASAAIKHVEDSATSLGGTLGKITQNAAGFAAGLAAIAGVQSVFDAVGGVVVGFNSKLEQSTISWTTFTSNADAAAAVLQQVQQIAATTPFEFNDVDQAAKRFVNAGMSAQQALNFITPLSNAVASVGLGAVGVDRVSLALSQMSAKGKATGEEIRQLTEAQIPAWQILADATGKPIPELIKLSEQGKISSKEFIDAFGQFYGATGKFADAAHNQSLTLQGSLSTIKDELNIVGSTAFKPLFDALSQAARAFAAFVQSDQFTVWGGRVQAVVGLIVDGLGGLSGAFYNTLGGVLQIVNSVGQAIYTGLQWLNPFAPHSPPLVSQVQDGVKAIESAYGGLSGLTSTFDGIGGAFEGLADQTAAFGETVDGTSLKTERALAVMGPGVTDAFNQANAAIGDAKENLAEIKESWDQASDALAPLKDNLGATKDALKDQKDALGDLQSQLSDAKAAFDPLNDALKSAQQNAKDAESAIKDLTSAPIAGSAEFEKRISDANIALKQQSLALSNVKQSTAFQSIGDQIDAATAKLKDMQRQQSTFIPNLPANASDSQKKAHAEAVERNRELADQQRKAITDQQEAIDSLKNKQAGLLDPAQKELDKRRQNLDAINLEKDATIGVAQERIKSAAAAALGVKEQTEAQIKAAIEFNAKFRNQSLGEIQVLGPKVEDQQSVIDGLTARVRDQQHAVENAQKATDAANQTYSDAKEKVDDLGSAYRDTKSQVAAYEAQLKSTIAAGDTQVQKIKAADAAAKQAAKNAPTPTTPKVDVLAGLDIEGSKAKIKAFSDQVASTRASITGNLTVVSDKWNAVWSGVNNVLATVLVKFAGVAVVSDAIDFIKRFVGVAAGLAAGLALVSPLIGAFGAALAPVGALVAAVLTPVGLLVVGIAALTAAWTLNIGNIQDSANGLALAFFPLTLLPDIVDRALSGDVLDAFTEFVDVVSAVKQNLIQAVAGWAAVFVDWALPLLPGLLAELQKVGTAVVGWILAYGNGLFRQTMRWADAFVGWLLPRIPAILDMLETLGQSIFTWIRGEVPRFINMLGLWATAFVQWIIPLLPELVASLETIANRMILWIRDGVPAFLGALADWAGAFIQWIAPLIPDILGALAGLLGEIIRWAVEEALPSLATTLLVWGQAFINWVVPLIPPLLAEVAKILDRLKTWIIETAAPAIGAAVVKWADAFWHWIQTDALPGLKVAIEDIWTFLGPWIHDRVKDLGAALGEWAAAFVNWITDPGGALDALTVQLPKILTGINDWIVGSEKTLTDSANQMGPWVVKGFIDGLGGLKDALTSALMDAWEAAKDSFLKNFKPISIPNPFANGGGSSGSSQAPAAGTPASSGMSAAFALAQKTAAQGAASTPYIWGGAQGRSQEPNIFTGGDCSGFVAWVYYQATGKKLPAYVADLVDGKITQQIDRSAALPGDLAIFNPRGAPDEQHVGIVSQAGGGKMIDESTATGGGVQERNVGASAQFYRVLGAAARDAAVDVKSLIPPMDDVGLRIQSIPQDIMPAGNALDALAMQTGHARGSFLELASGAQDSLPQVPALINSVTYAANNLASDFGISLDQANAILNDHGNLIKQVLGTDVPDAFSITDQAVEEFAAKFGVNWEQARAILTAGGSVADAVLGKQIPAAAQATVDAITSAGNQDIWDKITSNAAIAGADIKKYMADTGAQAIDVATASLTALRKASGLSFPQIEAMAAAAGQDVDTWLRRVAVPAAQAFAASLGPQGVAGASNALQAPLDALKAVAAKMGTEGLAVAVSAAKDLESQFPGLTDAVNKWIATLGGIPKSVTTDIVTNFKTNGVPPSGTPAAIAASAAGSSTPSKSQGDVIAPDSLQGSSQAAQSARADYRAAHPDAIVSSNASGNVIITHRAVGGPVYAGKPYIVGEQGPELITPGHSGTVHTAAATAALAQTLSGSWGLDPAMLAQVTAAVQAFGRAIAAMPHSVALTLSTAVRGLGDVQSVAASLDSLPQSVAVPVAVDAGDADAVMAHLADTFRAVPRSVRTMLTVDASAGLRTVGQVAAAVRAVPSTRQIGLAVNTLGGSQALQSVNRQSTGPATGVQAVQAARQFVARPGSGPVQQQSGKFTREDARMIADELSSAFEDMPAPRLVVDDVHESLLRKKRRNGSLGLS